MAVAILTVSLLLLTVSLAQSEIGELDYMVDCSACQSIPFNNINAYSCKVRCQVEGESEKNLTGLYTLLTEVLQKLDNTTKELEKTKQTVESLTRSVLFAVKTTTTLHTNPNDVAIFDYVITNVGDAYDVTTGKFTAPQDGFYEFSLVTMNGENTYCRSSFMKGDVEIFKVFSGHDDYLQSSGTVTVELTAQDEVYIMTTGEPCTYQQVYNIFTGHLII